MSTETKTHRILRFILFLSNSYPKSKDECIAFLGIGDTAFYSYCNTLKETGFDLFEFKDDFKLVRAFDTMLKQNRQFKVCRIEDVQETLIPWRNEQFHHSKPVDVFRNTGDLNKQIELRMNLKARNLLIEEYPLSERHLERIGNNQYRLTIQVAKYEGLGRFVMGLIDDIQVVGDDGFLEYLKTKIKKIRIS